MKRALMILAVLAMAFAGCHKENDNNGGGNGNGGNNGGGSSNPTTGTVNGHVWLDMGLPSGTLWATCNVGANSPEEYGDYFAWGETESKAIYNWSTYKYANGSYDRLTKYCNYAGYGDNGFTDTLTALLPEDDAATANWGGAWRMPTADEMRELRDNCTHKWTTQNGVAGHLFTALNGNTLFLPAAGYRYDDELSYAGSGGYSWSSSLSAVGPGGAWLFYFDSEGFGMSYHNRNFGFTVRPVCPAQN